MSPMRLHPWLTPELILLDDRCPLPLDRPFTAAQAHALGVSRWYLRVLVERALVREVLVGVYAAAQVRDSLELKAEALRLVVPDAAIIVDRTAAWFHGIDVLGGAAMHEPPPVDLFHRQGSRVRRSGVRSGRRTLLDTDVMEVAGLPVTTPLRTALDLGRLLRRYDAIGALDAMLGQGVSREQLLGSVERFRGERGVVQLRELAPLADDRAESPPESRLRLVWIDTGLPKPEPQWWVYDDAGVPLFRIDVALPRCRFGAEYHGVRFHTGEDAEAYDEARGQWLAERGDWHVLDFWNDDLYGRDADPGRRLLAGLAEARRNLGGWVPQGKFL